jgi:cytochrome c biogenesis protein CcmG/thiol:disulfide interchange protein DsbE
MSGYKQRVLAFTLLVVGIMLYSNHRLRMNPARGRNDRSLAPDFQLQTIDGAALRLSDYRGKAVLLNFWATWCPPCREEIPWFVDFQKEYGPLGLQVLGISVENGEPKEVTDFIRKFGVNYPVLVGNDQVAAEYAGVEGLPTTIYIGRDGHITRFVEGLVGHHEWNKILSKLSPVP